MRLQMSVPFANEVDRSTALPPFHGRRSLVASVLPHEPEPCSYVIWHGRGTLQDLSRGTQTPGETLESQQGTCRDFALLMMEAARSLGFAARFVTGYVYVPDRDGPVRLGGGSTHAWCQIYVPGSGWVEFDPTNGIVGNRDLIRVGVARTPEQAIPLSGSYWGDAEEELGMEVTVNVKTEGGSPSLSAVDAK